MGKTLNPAMSTLWKFLQKMHDDENGATATEYIVLLILIACFIILIVKVYGITVSRKFQAAEEYVNKEVTIY
ncbi:MAG: Flp family type IVb pilin [Bradymonadaceae bacterium]